MNHRGSVIESKHLNEADASPPRRPAAASRNFDGNDSPPRRPTNRTDRRNYDDNSPPRRPPMNDRRKDNDTSPPRRPPTHRKYESDESPPRRNSSSQPSRDNKNSFQPKRVKYQPPTESMEYEWGKTGESIPNKGDDTPAVSDEDQVKPNFGLSGALAKDERTGNMKNGVLLQFSESQDSASPTMRWRLYVFKDKENIDVLHIHRKSVYLFGRDERVADIHIAHPSCSKQHAVIQFRMIRKRDPTGHYTEAVKPYLMDLESSNKTILNGSEIDGARYYELLVGDCIRFGSSAREYVVMNEEKTA